MSSSFFGRIPTVSELLNNPALRPWVERANRTQVATTVRSFVNRVTADLQSRTADMKVPTVSELAERIAEWIARQRGSGPQAEINATGVLLPPHAALPLADEALQALQATLRDYASVRSREEKTGLAASQEKIADLARQLSGAEGALVTATHSGALLLALAATCQQKAAVVARGQVGEVEPDVPLPRIAESAGVPLRECGTVERVSLDDYSAALADAGCLLTLAQNRYEIAGSAAPALSGDLASVARSQRVEWIADLGLGGFVDPSRFGLSGIPQAAAAINAGADLVIVSGDCLTGGPACGIVLGRRASLDRLRRHPLWPSLAAPATTLVPLAVTLELQQDPEGADRSIPLLSLLSTSVENLQGRAMRLAAQLAALPVVLSAEATAGTASLLGRNLAGQQLATWQIVIAPREMPANKLAERLSEAIVPIRVLLEGERLILDLRSVFPRQDMFIVETFESLSPTPPN